jgi:hypothetical protein
MGRLSKENAGRHGVEGGGTFRPARVEHPAVPRSPAGPPVHEPPSRTLGVNRPSPADVTGGLVDFYRDNG